MKIVIAGAGEIGSHLAKLLSRESNEITIVDDNPERLRSVLSTADVIAVEGNPTTISILRNAEVSKADLFIAVYPHASQEINVLSAIVAKRLGARKAIARINELDSLSAENKLMYKEMGVDLMLYPEKIAADEIVSQIRHAASAETMDFVHGKLQMSAFKLDDEAPILDCKLIEFMKSLPPEEAKNFRIIAISRKDETIIPSLDTKFLFGDIVFTISTRDGYEGILRHFGKIDNEVNRVMILGGSSTAEMLALLLCKQISEVKIIEKNRGRCLELSEKMPGNVRISCGDGRNSDLLFDEGIKDYDAFVALTGNDESNVLASVVAKKFGVQRTVAEVENIEYIRLAEDMGVDSIINKKLITAGRIFKYTLSGKARFVRYISGTSAEVMEYTVAPGSRITKAPLKEMDFPKNAIIGGVVRGTEAMIAVGDTHIEAYDRVAVFALPEEVKNVDKFFK